MRRSWLGDAFLNQTIKNVTEARRNIDVLLQVLRHLFKIAATILEFNTFLTCPPDIFIFQKVQERRKGSATLASVLTRKGGFTGDVYMIKIFQ